MSERQHRELEALYDKIYKVLGNFPEWDNTRIAKALKSADPSVHQSVEYLSRVVGRLRGTYWNVEDDDVDSVKQLLQ